ncbi:MAG: toll/interleukin-1 receptor domain-containing protein [Candidatus Bathyarchaeia archaeon]
MQASKESYTYDIFVSYNKADTEFAERLVKRIESEQYNDRQLRCFYAPWDIQPGENVLLRIEKAETTSRFVALVMSPDWLKSDWTTLERVIPVYEDPAGLKGRVIPILRRNCNIPPSIRILDWLDFTHDINFERELNRLLARLRGEPFSSRVHGTLSRRIHSGSSVAAYQDETLASDLFPILQLPSLIYVGSVKVKDRNEVFSMLGEGATLPPFAIREEEHRVYSFAPLQSNQFRLSELLNEKTTQTFVTSKLIAEKAHSAVIIELLNRSMTAHMRNLGMVYDWNTKKTFYPLETNIDTDREATWRVGSRKFTRKLVVKSKKGDYFAHRSCKATFTDLSGSLFLKILPGWHFTLDGMIVPIPMPKMASLSTRWMNIERNHTVLDNVRFWAYVLSRDAEKIMMDVGSDVAAETSAVPLIATIDHGIDGDYRERMWYEAEPEADEAEQALDEVEQGETLEEDNES